MSRISPINLGEELSKGEIVKRLSENLPRFAEEVGQLIYSEINGALEHGSKLQITRIPTAEG